MIAPQDRRFTLLLTTRSYCVTRDQAQALIHAFERRDTEFTFTPLDGEAVTIALCDLVRIWEHDGERNARITEFLETSRSNVVPLFGRTPR